MKKWKESNTTLSNISRSLDMDENALRNEIQMMQQKLANLASHMIGLTLSQRQQEGVKEEDNLTQDVGDAIDQTYQTIDEQISAAQARDDENSTAQIEALEALKPQVVAQFSFGRDIETYLNDQINQIIGQNVSKPKGTP